MRNFFIHCSPYLILIFSVFLMFVKPPRQKSNEIFPVKVGLSLKIFLNCIIIFFRVVLILFNIYLLHYTGNKFARQVVTSFYRITTSTSRHYIFFNIIPALTYWYYMVSFWFNIFIKFNTTINTLIIILR